MRGHVFALGLVLPVVALAVPADLAPSAEDEAVFRRLEPHMATAGLRLEEATLESAMRRFGTVDRQDWLKGTRAPFICYVGPDGTRLGLGFGTSEGLLVLRRFELAAPGTSLECVPNHSIAEVDRPRCVAVMKLAGETTGRLRLGMTRAEVNTLLGKENGGAGEDSWSYSGSVKLQLSPAQADILREAGVPPEDFLVERELRLEFKADRLVGIRVRQVTKG
jgi:hypothetical protein